VQRSEDRHEVENLMAKYCYLHMRGLHVEQAEQLFAKHSPGTAVQITNWGIYDGYNGVERCYPGFHTYLDAHASPDGKGTGHMSQHTLTTAVIEVAGDGKTAKECGFHPATKTGYSQGKWLAKWVWGYYGCDFVKEDGKWRILHLRVYRHFSCPLRQRLGRSRSRRPDEIDIHIPDEFKPDRPPLICGVWSNPQD